MITALITFVVTSLLCSLIFYYKFYKSLYFKYDIARTLLKNEEDWCNVVIEKLTSLQQVKTVYFIDNVYDIRAVDVRNIEIRANTYWTIKAKDIIIDYYDAVAKRDELLLNKIGK